VWLLLLLLQVHLQSRTRGALGRTYMSPGGCVGGGICTPAFQVSVVL
jgi:hypothetical protein